jgi:hypothetical protein
MDKKRNWIVPFTTITAVIAWALANGLDVISMSWFVREGGQLILGRQIIRHHPAEFVVLYAGMRMLGTLAVYLSALFIEKHWPSISQTLWGTLTACSLMTAVVAWWRVW